MFFVCYYLFWKTLNLFISNSLLELVTSDDDSDWTDDANDANDVDDDAAPSMDTDAVVGVATADDDVVVTSGGGVDVDDEVAEETERSLDGAGAAEILLISKSESSRLSSS